MSHVITERITLETDTCAACGVVFAMPEYLVKKRREDGANFYCPNGHALHFGDSLKIQNDQLKQRLEGEARRLESAQRQIEHEKRLTAAQKGQVTRLKNRAANGVCPCCNRYFANMHRHMTTKHPDYVGQGVTA